MTTIQQQIRNAALAYGHDLGAHAVAEILASVRNFDNLLAPRESKFKTGISVALAANVLVHESHSAMLHAGWWKDTETGDDVREWPKKYLDLFISSKLMLIVTEVGEAMEGHRKHLPDDKLPHRSMLEVELADAVLRITDLAGALGLDLGGAIEEKMAYNAQRADHKIENRIAEGGKSI